MYDDVIIADGTFRIDNAQNEDNSGYAIDEVSPRTVYKCRRIGCKVNKQKELHYLFHRYPPLKYFF